MKSRARHLAEKSVDAMLAAIEIYNKPSFAYREESFAILAVNAWELLLKARLLDRVPRSGVRVRGSGLMGLELS